MILPQHLLQRWPLFLIAGLIVFLLVITLVGDRGAVHLWRLRSEKARLDALNFRQQQTNDALRRRIMMIRNDDRYLEKLAREDLNMVRPGEVVYRFANAENRKAAENASR